MELNTVIFDMDGLLIDSEPLWEEATEEVFKQYNVTLSHQQYLSSTGLRTKEFVQWWFGHFQIADEHLAKAEADVIASVLEKVKLKGLKMPGVDHIFKLFFEYGFKMGVASSSPMNLIDLVVDKLEIKPYLSAIVSAESLEYGKPHPQVYLNCADALGADPANCVCFEDSFNGMIAAKAARMKCVIVPAPAQQKQERWAAADLKLSSLQNFGDLHLQMLQG